MRGIIRRALGGYPLQKGQKNNGVMRAKAPHYSVIFHFIDKLTCSFGQDNLPQNKDCQGAK